MQDIKHRDAIVIGSTNLCIACVKILLSRQWKIIVVITNDIAVQQFCEESSLKTVKISQLSSIINEKFYLFSIANLNIIPKKFFNQNIIELALNYHDSLLPRYAGLNSTTWAILNEEKNHGVTWHVITDKIDAGNIATQQIIHIDLEDTSELLNLKCTQAAYLQFLDLIKKIENNQFQSYTQSTEQHSYFGRKNIPTNYAILNINNNEHYINKLFKALTFGDEQINTVATVKCYAQEKFYILENLSKQNPNNIKIINNNLEFFVEKIRDIYGNEIIIPGKELHTEECILNKNELSIVSTAKSREGDIQDTILEHLNKKIFFHVIYLDAPPCINPVTFLNEKYGFSLNTLFIINHKNNHLSGALNKLLDVVSFITPIDIQRNELDKALNKKSLITKDFYYRYKLNNLLDKQCE